MTMLPSTPISRRRLSVIAALALALVLLVSFRKASILPGGKASKASHEELLPTSLVDFISTCANETESDVRKAIEDRLFDGKSPYDGFPSSGMKNLLDGKVRLQGWGSRSPVFERLMKEVKPKVVIEIGTFLGASAVNMARLAEGLGLQTLILCVDDFRGWPGFREKFSHVKQLNGDVMLLQSFMNNVIKSGVKDEVLPIPFSTAHSLTFFCKEGIYADLIEVDAGHDFHSAWLDINMAYQVLRPGGVMFGHDFFNKADKSGVRRAVLLFAQRHGLQVEPDGAHWILRPHDYKLPTGDSSISKN